MKYIKTKDGHLYKVIKEYPLSYSCEDIETPEPFDVCTILKTEIIAQADTIEELCDFYEALWFDGEYEMYYLPKEQCITVLTEDLKVGDVKSLKFGIRTDKGLIYVAKMNEDGELELL